MSASSCGSIKALAEWICGHLLWTEIQGAELCGANICNVCLDLTLHARHADNKHSPARARARAGTQNLCTPALLGEHISDRIYFYFTNMPLFLKSVNELFYGFVQTDCCVERWRMSTVIIIPGLDVLNVNVFECYFLFISTLTYGAFISR